MTLSGNQLTDYDDAPIKNADYLISSAIEKYDLTPPEIQQFLITYEKVVKTLLDYKTRFREEEQNQKFTDNQNTAILNAYNYAKYHFIIERFNSGDWVDALFHTRKLNYNIEESAKVFETPSRTNSSSTKRNTSRQNYSVGSRSNSNSTSKKKPKKKSKIKSFFSFFKCGRSKSGAMDDEEQLDLSSSSSVSDLDFEEQLALTIEQSKIEHETQAVLKEETKEAMEAIAESESDGFLVPGDKVEEKDKTENTENTETKDSKVLSQNQDTDKPLEPSQDDSKKSTEKNDEFDPNSINFFEEDFEYYLESLERKYNSNIHFFSQSGAEQSKQVIIDLLRSEGSLWDGRSPIGTFINLFLAQLRHTNIEVYRDLIEKTYNQPLIKDARLLYRGDTRPFEEIFREGFKLKPQANDPSIAKINYCRAGAGSTGISMTHDPRIASSYGGGGYYTIQLPEGHRVLISDFSHAEVNSFEEIPGAYIVSYTRGNTVEPNPNYVPGRVEPSPTIRRGCY